MRSTHVSYALIFEFQKMQAKHILMTLSPRKPLSAESRSSNLLCLYLLFVANAVDLQKPEIVHCA
jgi:hypothetical protein